MRSRFYVTMAWVGAVVVAVGFARRYFAPLAAGTMDAPALVHLHGLFLFGWIALFVVQTSLVATRRTALHRSLGLAGIALGTLVVFTALELAVRLLAHELDGGGPPFVREFVATLLGWALLAAGLFAAAIASVKRPEVHKRLMLLAAFVILAPAFARIIQLVDGDLTRLLRNDLANLPVDALVLVAVARDGRARGRPHPAYLAGGAAIACVQVATLVVRSTPAWHAATTWIAALAR